MFHRFGGMCSFLLSIIRRENIDDGHEIDLLLGGTWSGRENRKEGAVARRRAESSWVHNPQV